MVTYISDIIIDVPLKDETTTTKTQANALSAMFQRENLMHLYRKVKLHLIQKLVKDKTV